MVAALKRWNFVKGKGGGHITFTHDNGVHTMMSHSKKVSVLDAEMLQRMAVRLKLSLSDFIDLIDDKKSQEADYKMRRTGNAYKPNR